MMVVMDAISCCFFQVRELEAENSLLRDKNDQLVTSLTTGGIPNGPGEDS